jgi:hypothetical protein
MAIDRKLFFGKARANPFGKKLTQAQVIGLNAILRCTASKLSSKAL